MLRVRRRCGRVAPERRLSAASIALSLSICAAAEWGPRSASSASAPILNLVAVDPAPPRRDRSLILASLRILHVGAASWWPALPVCQPVLPAAASAAITGQSCVSPEERQAEEVGGGCQKDALPGRAEGPPSMLCKALPSSNRFQRLQRQTGPRAAPGPDLRTTYFGVSGSRQ